MAVDSAGRSFDAFDGPMFHKTVDAQSPQDQSAYIMYFGKEQLPSIIIALKPERRAVIEEVHAIAAELYLRQAERLPNAIALREASLRVLEVNGVLHRVAAT